jgi:hypothetical protein
MSRQFFATTRDGKRVYIDPQDSHVATHLVDTPQLAELAGEVVASLEVGERDSLYLEQDMGRIVGVSDLVATNPSDSIIYAKRPNRDNYTRFVQERQPQATSYVTIILRQLTDTEYELWSAWIGRVVPGFPGDEHETPDSRPSWQQHALVWGNQAIQPGTERSDWPW